MEGTKTPIHYYVDYGNGDDATGDGTISNPWKTIQHALDTITRNTVNTAYDQINLKSNAVHVTSAPLSFATYGRPASRGQLVIRGYGTTANDGGIASISGNGTHSVNNSDSNVWYTWLRDLDIGNCGANYAWTNSGRYVHAVNVKFHDAGNGFGGGLFNKMFFCITENISGLSSSSSSLHHCLFSSSVSQCAVFGCLFDVDESGIVVDVGGSLYALGNIVRNSSGTGTGLRGNADNQTVIADNIISGCDIGVSLGSLFDQGASCHGNAVFDCNTPYLLQGAFFAGSNEILTEDPFTDWPNVVQSYTHTIRNQSFLFSRGPIAASGTAGFYNPFRQPIMGGV